MTEMNDWIEHKKVVLSSLDKMLTTLDSLQEQIMNLRERNLIDVSKLREDLSILRMEFEIAKEKLEQDMFTEEVKHKIGDIALEKIKNSLLTTSKVIKAITAIIIGLGAIGSIVYLILKALGDI